MDVVVLDLTTYAVNMYFDRNQKDEGAKILLDYLVDRNPQLIEQFKSMADNSFFEPYAFPEFSDVLRMDLGIYTTGRFNAGRCINILTDYKDLASRLKYQNNVINTLNSGIRYLQSKNRNRASQTLKKALQTLPEKFPNNNEFLQECLNYMLSPNLSN